MRRVAANANRLLFLTGMVAMVICLSVNAFGENNNTPSLTTANSTTHLSRWRLSTNALPYSLTIISAAAEYLVSPKLSVELPIYYCPWSISRNFSVRTFATQPELRYWFRDNRRGHYVGLHASVAQFNVLIHRDRYQDSELPLLGAGISYGYLLPVSHRWSIRFSAGVGYCYARYQRFYNIANGALIDNRSTHYVGLDMIGVSIIYNL
ncbi:MAG: DUF3575 domain-containing protein [Muribaculaceae bacterium]|nr:DUF3575 domain-containing protein [Muribaculaceae bacterium]